MIAALRYWKPIAGGVLGLMVIVLILAGFGSARHWHKRFDAEHAARLLDQANMRAAAAQATANALARNDRVEAAQTKVTKETTVAIDDELGRARADAAAYTRGMRDGHNAAGSCPASSAAAARAPDAASVSDGAGRMSQLDADDVRICTDAVVKARGWQRFEGELNAIPQ